ncbi:MAG: SAM-dependent methyltransferase [Paenibacillaceae bacterium]|nr:SAM-dependent methyltransferase [Paenibacillaceae bacterium]
MKHPLDRPEGSSELETVIRRQICAQPAAAIPFRDYMELCLYHAELGYYIQPREKIGKAGDFYTASNIGGILGEAVAYYIARQSRSLNGPVRIVEWGAGTGRLAAQILDGFREHFPELYVRVEYAIVEKSPWHQKCQREQLHSHWHLIRQLTPEEAMQGEESGEGRFILSNELLDAFPVHRVRQRQGTLMELHVGWDESAGSFRELERPCVNEALTDYLRESGIGLAEGQTADISLEAAEWLEERLRRLKYGELITIDYGDTAAELFGTHRMKGTLLCYKNHLAAENPYIYAGEQDMTAHVDFTACIRAGAKSGITDWRLSTQKEFLLESGVLERLVSHDGRDPFSPAAKRNRAVRQLLLSDGMSELFKVLIQRRQG